jgi:hypothetical protein
MAVKDTLNAVVNELVSMGALVDNVLRIGPNVKGLRVAPPSIWFIPRSSIGSGPDAAVTRAQQTALGNIPRPLHTRNVLIDAHLWAKSSGDNASADDYSAGELFINQFLSALHHAAYGSYRFAGETWVNGGTDVTTLGRRIIVHITLAVPVIEYQINFPAKPEAVVVTRTEAVVVTRSTQTDVMGGTTSEQVG